jgi:Flp pilus assembly protein TadG
MLSERAGERGVVLVWLASMMALLLGVAALVLDLGVARQEKRQVQNSADAAALGAAQELPDLANADAEAKALVARNLGTTPTWTGCTDDRSLGLAASTPCVSYDPSFTAVRVRVPVQSVATSFAGVIGIDDVDVSAGATARLAPAGLGSIQPFALYAGSGPEACLKAGGSTPDPLCNNVTGNFGTLDVAMYGNEGLGTMTRCGNALQGPRLQNNIAIGIDHVVTVYTGSEVRDGCGRPGPNTLPTRTGNVVNDFDLGMLHGGSGTFDDGQPARLQRGTGPKATVAGVPADNTPLWEFVTPGPLPGAPPSCRRSVFDGLLASTPTGQQSVVLHAALRTCVADYAAGTGCGGSCTGVVFGADSETERPLDLADIQRSPRLVYVPRFAQATPPNGATSLHVAGLQAVFLQRLYGGCTATRCSTDFEPGPWNTATNGQWNDNANAVTAFVIAPGMLPEGLAAPYRVGHTAVVELVQ